MQISSLDAAIGGGGSLNTTWQQKGARITTPANAAKVRIRLMNYMNSGWVAYDKVSLKQVGVYNLSYDAENRLVGVSGAATASFVYDGDSNRVKALSTTGVEDVTKVYIGNYPSLSLRTCFEWQVSNGEITRYYYAGSQRIAMRTGTGSGTSGLTFLFGDHLGSTSVSYKADGTQTLRQLYLPWGEVITGTLQTDYTYTGQKSHVNQFGLMYYVARYYDPTLGVFTQPDTIVPLASQGVQAWNRYAYVNDSPLVNIDPSGHERWYVAGWDDQYKQIQRGNTCAVVAVAVALSIVYGSKVTQDDLQGLYPNTYVGIGALPQQQAAIANLDPAIKATYTSHGTRADLMKNLKNDLPTIVSFTLPGWEVGHAIVTIGYDTTTCEILFFNPATGNIESESEILNRYRKGRVFGTFDDLWAASNLVISSNSMVTVQKIPLETDKPIISSSEGGGGGLIGPLSNVLR